MLVYVFMPNLNVEKAKVSVSAIDHIIDEKGTVPSLGTMSRLTGMAPLIIAINDLIIEGQFQTLALSVFMCWALLSIWFRSWKLGLITMIPCILVISYEPATLVMMNIPLSIVTVMIGAIAIGTGVDFSIQITQRLNLMGYGIKQVLSTVEHMGVSFVEATATMVLGFSAVLIAPWPSNAGTFGLPFTFGVGIDAIKQFVIMIMLLLIFNAICALLVLPAIYTLMIRFRESEQKRKREMAIEAGRHQEDRELPAELEEEEPETPEVTVKQKVKIKDDEDIPKIY
jgi:predicted RND superfamily exporter protein